MLDINHLSFSRGNHKLLDNVSARLPTNQITALIGPNGVGKSTLIQLLTAELLPDSGSVINHAKHVAVLSQHNQLYEPLSVRELLQLSHATMDEELINTLQLTPLLDQEMTDLSGGQQQQPDLLILDEPTTFLDLHFQELFLKTLHQLQEKRQMTVLMVLHDLNQAFRYSQHIWLLRRTADLVSEAAVLMQNQIDLLSEAFETPLQLIKTPNQTIIQPK